MAKNGNNYAVEEVGPLATLLDHEFRGLKGKHFIGKNIGLTGCEVSLNLLPAGKAMPFVHAHRNNEELYIIIAGNGTFFVDGDEFPVQEGSMVRVAPEGARSWKAGDHDLYFICVQAEVGTLTRATLEDGFRIDAKASWM